MHHEDCSAVHVHSGLGGCDSMCKWQEILETVTKLYILMLWTWINWAFARLIYMSFECIFVPTANVSVVIITTHGSAIQSTQTVKKNANFNGQYKTCASPFFKATKQQLNHFMYCPLTVILLFWKRGLPQKCARVLYCPLKLVFFLTVCVFGSSSRKTTIGFRNVFCLLAYGNGYHYFTIF